MRQDRSVAETLRSRKTWLRAGVATGVALVQGVLFFSLSQTADLPPLLPAPPIEVELFDLTPPPPPPPPPPSNQPDPGGGQADTPSRVHVPPPRPNPPPPELPAPVAPAPEPDPFVIGVAPIASPEPDMGQGGQGTGVGGGTGSGVGGGGSAPPRIIRGPSQGQIRAAHPPAAMRRRQSGEADIHCLIRLDTRLERCRITGERPSGQGFGQAALGVMDAYRFRPPTENGQPQAGQGVTVTVRFGPPQER